MTGCQQNMQPPVDLSERVEWAERRMEAAIDTLGRSPHDPALALAVVARKRELDQLRGVRAREEQVAVEHMRARLASDARAETVRREREKRRMR